MCQPKTVSRILRPLIKYPGGKDKELSIIAPRIPEMVANYYEPFFGGGAVYFALMPGDEKYINDKSSDLTNFYTCVKNRNKTMYRELAKWNDIWKKMAEDAATNMDYLRRQFESGDEIDIENELLKSILNDKFLHIRKKAAECGEVRDFEDNIEAAYKQTAYTMARAEYNKRKRYDGVRAALFVIMRQYAFSGMFRYNANGDFNIPYGGVAYNDKYLDERIETMKSTIVRKAFRKTVIGNMDFLEFMRSYPPENDDFVFLDPPYDTEFSSYENNSFDRGDQSRLADYLINECKGRWMLVIKATDFIRSLYELGTPCANGDKVHIFEFDKRYDVCILGRNKQSVEHLLITNYDTKEDAPDTNETEVEANGEACGS